MKTIRLLFLFLPLWASAQVIDDFSDGDFTSNPTWIGTDTCFTVNNNKQLQSAATVAGESYLSTTITERVSAGAFLQGETEWRFFMTSMNSILSDI